jgi:hypothetical protein
MRTQTCVIVKRVFTNNSITHNKENDHKITHVLHTVSAFALSSWTLVSPQGI